MGISVAGIDTYSTRGATSESQDRCVIGCTGLADDVGDRSARRIQTLIIKPVDRIVRSRCSGALRAALIERPLIAWIPEVFEVIKHRGYGVQVDIPTPELRQFAGVGAHPSVSAHAQGARTLASRGFPEQVAGNDLNRRLEELPGIGEITVLDSLD